MEIKSRILQYAQEKKKFRTSDVVKAFNNEFSRPYISSQLAELVKRKQLVRAGSGPKVFYALPENFKLLLGRVHRKLKNDTLEEHEVIEKLSSQTPFLLALEDNVRSIFDYAFSEMLNNAIEHSSSEFIEVEVLEANDTLDFIVRDFGVGVFRNVMEKYNLESELDAIRELLKGKVTTQPQSHSGEGIFFTSRIADNFELNSFGYKLIVDSNLKDIFIEESKQLRGTEVIFRISLKSDKHLNDVFEKYQSEPDSHAFDKTEVHVKLYKMGTAHISRSQARRVLSRLDKFKKVILDFDQVPTVGQAFADEVFRVYQRKNSDTQLVPINMNSTVEFMVNRVERDVL